MRIDIDLHVQVGLMNDNKKSKILLAEDTQVLVLTFTDCLQLDTSIYILLIVDFLPMTSGLVQIR